ncbi:hypothetical protein C2G38_2212690 [Gigaspora rosea]|uniref:Uncharacterized protein n=1 Tax=Gigaspora rosea TaxID=44941 RepID=A0A397UG33_9GLOM|nr:hypothetical protein C2G38_2212690 [Gigaspora rosea]
MNEEQNKTLEELRRFRFNWQPISTTTRRKKTKRYPQDKDILESRELIQITDDIWKTINDLINRINPTNNSRLGAILLTLEGAKSIAREFYPHVLEYNKQRPNKIPAHILTRTQTLFPELTGRALVREQEKQRNIYTNFLDNTQAQIKGIKKRLLAESPKFCKIFEDNPETGETEFYYGDYKKQFTIIPLKLHHLILHHLEAIDNILYSEGAKNKIYFEEEESYESAYSEINKLSQEFIDKTKKVKELRKEKERLEQITNKIRPEYLFEQYYLFLVKPEDLGETKYIKKNIRKESIETLYKNLEKLKSDLKEELFELALRYESKNNETLNIHNCYENEEYWEIVETIRRINITIDYQEATYSPYYQAQPEKEKQERLQNFYIKFLEDLYEKQVGIWIANQYTIVETYEELEKYHEQYWEREPISILEQLL